MKPTVLVVDDEPSIVTLLRYNLEREGFLVRSAADGQEALLQVEEFKPDLLLLDWMLPLVSGIEVCRRLRAHTETKNLPIIMLSARGEEEDRVKGLDLGADDYVTKPFSPGELLSRVRAVLRRIRPALAEKTISHGPLFMDLGTHRVMRDGHELHLSPTEFGLLQHFMEHPGRVFTREQLLDAVWGRDIYVGARTVDVHIRRLRKSLDYNDQQPDIIRTVRSAGYALEIPPSGGTR